MTAGSAETHPAIVRKKAHPPVADLVVSAPMDHKSTCLSEKPTAIYCTPVVIAMNADLMIDCRCWWMK
jgi:hypothetical protein